MTIYESSSKIFHSELAKKIYEDKEDYFSQEKYTLLSEAIHYQLENNFAFTYPGLICAIMSLTPEYIANMDESNSWKQKEKNRWRRQIRIEIIHDINNYFK